MKYNKAMDMLGLAVSYTRAGRHTAAAKCLIAAATHPQVREALSLMDKYNKKAHASVAGVRKQTLAQALEEAAKKKAKKGKKAKADLENEVPQPSAEGDRVSPDDQPTREIQQADDMGMADLPSDDDLDSILEEAPLAADAEEDESDEDMASAVAAVLRARRKK